ncbi:hypothetical protein [Clostridium saccharobutylicum]|uniref:Uncharacterized protein n=1 Tax=Clostridium saccharobutylicum DSM 13864 TaxID=1345695 RepID=U5MUX5_CLOSA|nr:hypothetical protein [Clostridium saccharobutylicum]AGX43262.1 hypothetical protein CLSA_c22870 [Clostridium saccharobutylicum DSM 13864]AQR90562.1 hypothetical protein CLOSC_22830 [Clostridium saccharobutylicum]AQS00466.1 hypothetical protein CSACC_22900 [Clostridium saccharobutylicum]AQS10116.1 hypothetical protein CLOBY_22590 [Clostridium saccharobutylicum]AQS14449.1 hypothetical protein CLOSACC_22900 [Clostridium saccharobutylicum]
MLSIIFGIIIVGTMFGLISAVGAGEIMEGCLTGIIGIAVVIFISGLCFKIHPILGTIVLIIGLRQLGRN